MIKKLFAPIVLLSLLVYACSTQSTVNPDDPFDDPFFSDSFSRGTSSLDEILREPSPSVGWLAREGAVPPSRGGRRGSYADDGVAMEQGENVLLEAESGDGDSEIAYGEEEEFEPVYGQRSFYDRASEATLATMSVLVGAGMAALPFLVGAY